MREYELDKKSESIISLKADRNALYKTCNEIKNAVVGEIYYLINKLSIEKYNMELDKLSEEQLSEINKVYPENFAE